MSATLAQVDVLGLAGFLGSLLFFAGLVWLLFDSRSSGKR